MSKTNKLNAVHLLFSDASGQYIPQRFAQECAELWAGFSAEDVAILSEGPDHENYWDAWHSVLQDARFTKDGRVWTLYQDGDCFAICHDLMTDEECENFDIDYPSASGETLEYYVDQAIFAAIENDDFSGIDNSTEKLAREFDASVLSGKTVDVRTRPAEFKTCEVTGLKSDCLTVWVTPIDLV